jgi:hypothetical protein
MKTYEVYLSTDPVSNTDYPEKYWLADGKFANACLDKFKTKDEALCEAQKQVQIYRIATDFNLWFFLEHYIAVIETDEDDNETIIKKIYLNPEYEEAL